VEIVSRAARRLKRTTSGYGLTLAPKSLLSRPPSYSAFHWPPKPGTTAPWRLPPFSCSRSHQRLPAGVVVLDLHGDDSADAQAVDHDAEQRPIAQADEGRGIDGVEQTSVLILGEHRCLTAAHDVLRSAHRMRGIDGEDLADHQPIEQHADGGKVQFDCRLGSRRLQRLYISKVRTRLTAGGRWIRTFGSGASGEAGAILPVKDRPR
jgi:hypothetical protein